MTTDYYEDAGVSGEDNLSALRDALGKQVGPLKVWHWIIVIVGGLGLAWYIRSRARGVEGETTAEYDPYSYAGSAALSPDPTVIVQPTDPAQVEYYESILGLLEQLGQEGLTVNPPAEGWPITTPVPINVDAGGEVMEELLAAEQQQTKLAQIAALRAQIAVIDGQIAKLKAAKAAATSKAAKKEIGARIKVLRQRRQNIRAQIRALQGGSSTVGGGTPASGSGSGAQYPF